MTRSPRILNPPTRIAWSGSSPPSRNRTASCSQATPLISRRPSTARTRARGESRGLKSASSSSGRAGVDWNQADPEQWRDSPQGRESREHPFRLKKTAVPAMRPTDSAEDSRRSDALRFRAAVSELNARGASALKLRMGSRSPPSTCCSCAPSASCAVGSSRARTTAEGSRETRPRRRRAEANPTPRRSSKRSTSRRRWRMGRRFRGLPSRHRSPIARRLAVRTRRRPTLGRPFAGISARCWFWSEGSRRSRPRSADRTARRCARRRHRPGFGAGTSFGARSFLPSW